MALCTPLSQFSVIKFQGPETETYLQGQITSDITKLDENHVQLACQCDSKGKVISIFYLLRDEDAVLLIGRRDSLNLSLAAFKKFAVFSKVEIDDISKQFFLYGFDEEACSNQVSSTFPDITLPEQVLEKSSNAQAQLFKLHDPNARFILLSKVQLDESMINGNEEQWLAADIQAGIPHILASASGEYIPQMLNLQALNAINFSKGCYMGQETVARAKYLGKNKRAGYILSADTDQMLTADDTVERQMGENWRRAGTIATIVHDADRKQSWMFAVLPNDLDADTALRLKSTPDLPLKIHPTPYSIE